MPRGLLLCDTLLLFLFQQIFARIMSSPLPFFSADCRCIVTGSTDPGSIGYACAVALLQAGVGSVTLSGRNVEKLAAAVALLKELSPNVYGVLADLKEPDQMAPAIEEASSLMGGLDVLVISGGNGGSEYLGRSTTDPNAFRLLHTMAVISPMLLTHSAIAQGATSIVMVTSMAAKVAWPDTAPYNTAKAAQNALVEQLAFQYRDTVRINAVLPACIHSVKLDVMAEKKNIPLAEYAALRASASPVGRNGTNEEVARSVVFLASHNYSSFTTGVLLPVDGALGLSSWWNKPLMLAEYKGV
jgi:NAD(P)-dependent dehydrogenase (short-subunit alcohol dehydrogenase family)